MLLQQNFAPLPYPAPNSYVDVLNPEPRNVTLFGIRVVTGAVSWDEVILEYWRPQIQLQVSV